MKCSDKSLRGLLEDVIFCKECEDIRNLDLEEKNKVNKLREEDIKTSYHVYSKGNKKDYMFLMETPGKGTRYKDEPVKIVNGGRIGKFDDYVSERQKGFIRWIKASGLSTEGDIVSIVNENLNVGINENNFLNYFHSTDVYKCREGDEKTCFNKFLKCEIEILKPKLILCFGRPAWRQIYKTFKPEPTGVESNIDETKVTKVHGMLFSFHIGKNEIFIIPCIHFSDRTRNSTPRTSYIDYFREGLEEYQNNLK